MPYFDDADQLDDVAWRFGHGTVPFRNGANPTVTDGGVAAGISAVIRIECNTTISGCIAACQIGYTRIASSMRSGGQLDAGDGGLLRFDSSTLIPVSLLLPAFPVDV